MFTSIDVSVVRERNAGLLRETSADRLERRLLANRGPRPGSRRAVGAFLPRRFAFPSARLGRTGGEG